MTIKKKTWNGYPNAEFLINWENMPVRHNFIFKKKKEDTKNDE